MRLFFCEPTGYVRVPQTSARFGAGIGKESAPSAGGLL